MGAIISITASISPYYLLLMRQLYSMLYFVSKTESFTFQQFIYSLFCFFNLPQFCFSFIFCPEANWIRFNIASVFVSFMISSPKKQSEILQWKYEVKKYNFKPVQKWNNIDLKLWITWIGVCCSAKVVFEFRSS